MSNRSISLTESLYDYLLSVSLREPPLLLALREETAALSTRSMQIAPEQGQFMALLLRLMGARRCLEVGVYTDNEGSAAANKNIAQRRAEVLREWLMTHGIEKRRLSIRGYGAVDFIAGNDTEDGRNQNRRVEVKRVTGDLRKHPAPEPEPAPEPAPALETPAAAAPGTPPAPIPETPPAPAPETPPAPAPDTPPAGEPAPQQPAEPAPTPRG